MEQHAHLDPTVVVIFGGGGDLTHRKLVPALYNLFLDRWLPQNFAILGIDRLDLNDDNYRSNLRESVDHFSRRGKVKDDEWNTFAPHLHYLSADFTDAGAFAKLREQLGNYDKEWRAQAHHIFYLATAPRMIEIIARQLHEVQLLDEKERSRLVVEKPFGHDLDSARKLNRQLTELMNEDQIYRIDHYLGKETVQNILVFRFANTLFEPLWNYNYIDHVQITVSETVKMEGRGEYYDKAGVLRDMFQNHLLQVLTLVAMEAPARFAADPLRNEKVKVLDAVPVYTPEEAAANVCTGQYAGYHSEKGVAPGSVTPTYAAVQLAVDNWRWRGVPFFLRSGKAMAQRLSEVVVQFRCPPHLMFPLPPGATLQCNRLSMCIQPDEGIHINFQTKVPDEAMTLRPADLEFHFKNAYPSRPIPEAYERLLLDAINGDAHLFMRSDEIERAWEIMDPIIAATERPDAPPPQEYAVGSSGPACADEFLARDGRAWLSLCRQ
jgi:glucose-6-phosphate 1-dehydrogenase